MHSNGCIGVIMWWTKCINQRPEHCGWMDIPALHSCDWPIYLKASYITDNSYSSVSLQYSTKPIHSHWSWKQYVIWNVRTFNQYRVSKDKKRPSSDECVIYPSVTAHLFSSILFMYTLCSVTRAMIGCYRKNKQRKLV